MRFSAPLCKGRQEPRSDGSARAYHLPHSVASRYLSLSRAFVSFGRASFAPSPLAARASAIRSCTCGRQRLAFLAASATGGARKPNPSEGAEAAPPQATELQRRVPQLSPPPAGCPHPSRCGAAPHRATFPKGKATRSPPQSTDFPQRKKCSSRFRVNAMHCRRYNPSVFLPERAKKQLPLHRGAEKSGTFFVK